MSFFAIAWRVAVVLFGATAFLPLGTNALSTRGGVVPSYDEAVSAVARIHAHEDSVVVPIGHSILLVHGAPTPRAIVLLHGLTNSPQQFRLLAEQLYAGGANVYVPRLPHHAELAGMRPLSRITAEELRDSGDSAVLIARALGD